MIVKDEAAFLDDALRSVAGIVDEVCIVDTGSTDDTVAIARRHGARVASVAWTDDFSAARNAALALATRAWIFVLDADERLRPESRAAVAALAAEPAGTRGKWIRCRNLADDVKGSGAMTNALVRIFPNHPRIRYRNPVHEFVALDGDERGLAADPSPVEIVHHGYLSAVVRDRAKGERNLRLSRIAAERDPADPFHQYNLGMALLLAGDRDGALAALERTRELTRESPRGYRVNALAVLADLYSEHRADAAAALDAVTECLQVAPTHAGAHFTHGRILAKTGDRYAARDAFGRAIAAGAHNADHFVVDDEISVWKAHNEIGATLMAEERWSEALQWFELAADARPAAQPLIVNRARCAEALGDLDTAEALLRAAFAGFADEPTAIEFVNFLLRRGRDDDALDAIETALPWVGDGYRCVFLATAAATHARAGRAADARAALDRALAVGDPFEARATVIAFARRAGIPEFDALLGAEPPRAAGLQIVYTGER